MIVGLSVAHLLKGIALIVQHPKRFRVYWVHLVWVLFLFLYLIHFWWWEFNLVKVREWTFPIYFFVAIYAILLYLLCSLFFPDQIGEYDGFKGYYYSRHQWIFAVMALLFVADIADGFIKGRDYFTRLGARLCHSHGDLSCPQPYRYQDQKALVPRDLRHRRCRLRDRLHP